MTGSRNAHKMSVTPFLMQVRRSAYAVYTKRMEEGKPRKEKDMQQKVKTSKEDPDIENMLK